MIFVTVGTHEQQFNRLVRCVDDMKKNGIIQDEVIIQTGFSEYEPQYCEWKKLYPYSDMVKFVKKARIVITHGGPSSFIMPLQEGKIPIVVPRRKEFDEHVNDHQVMFCHAVKERQKNIIVVDDIKFLQKIILDYDNIISNISNEISSNNDLFCEKFSDIVNELVHGDRK